jgi:hypothetical protein
VPKDCPCNEFTCAYAARKWTLEHLLQWLREKDCPWNDETCIYAAKEGHWEVLEWSRANGCPWTTDVCASAAENGHFRDIAMVSYQWWCAECRCLLSVLLKMGMSRYCNVHIHKVVHGIWRTCAYAAQNGHIVFVSKWFLQALIIFMFLSFLFRMSARAGVERLMVGSSDDRTADKVYARYPFATQNRDHASRTPIITGSSPGLSMKYSSYIRTRIRMDIGIQYNGLSPMVVRNEFSFQYKLFGSSSVCAMPPTTFPTYIFSTFAVPTNTLYLRGGTRLEPSRTNEIDNWTMHAGRRIRGQELHIPTYSITVFN